MNIHFQTEQSILLCHRGDLKKKLDFAYIRLQRQTKRFKCVVILDYLFSNITLGEKWKKGAIKKIFA